MSPASVTRLSQAELSQIGPQQTLPPGLPNQNTAVDCAVTGGGFVWVTDGQGAVYVLQPT